MATAAARRSHQLGTSIAAVIVGSIASSSIEGLYACQIHVTTFVRGHATVRHDTSFLHAAFVARGRPPWCRTFSCKCWDTACCVTKRKLNMPRLPHSGFSVPLGVRDISRSSPRMSDQSKRPSYLPSDNFNTLMQLSFFGTLGVLFFVLFVRRCSGRRK